MARALSSPCRDWLERDKLGRPRCEHGWAIKAGDRWRCPAKHAANCRRYNQTPAGKATMTRKNTTEHARSRKALYELTRIRIGG